MRFILMPFNTITAELALTVVGELASSSPDIRLAGSTRYCRIALRERTRASDTLIEIANERVREDYCRRRNAHDAKPPVLPKSICVATIGSKVLNVLGLRLNVHFPFRWNALLPVEATQFCTNKFLSLQGSGTKSRRPLQNSLVTIR